MFVAALSAGDRPPQQASFAKFEQLRAQGLVILAHFENCRAQGLVGEEVAGRGFSGGDRRRARLVDQ
jgi:hypothetical protein